MTSFGPLFHPTGKRSAEHLSPGDNRAQHRPVLARYSPAILRSPRVLAASVTVTACSLWLFQRFAALGHRLGGLHSIWFELSFVPVVPNMLHMELGFIQEEGGAPAELALHDWTLPVLGSRWAELFSTGICT